MRISDWSSDVCSSDLAWNALAAAAMGARALRLDPAQTAHALGIAEYYGPRSPMMRVIDHPTMLKDDSDMGAMSGVSAELLSAAGFTGAPADTEMGEAVARSGEHTSEHQSLMRSA